MTLIQDTLRNLGITRCYKGFDHTTYSIHLALEDDLRLLSIKKEIYMKTAEHYGCSWRNVERNIRTVVSRAWQVNPELLCEMAGYPLEEEPTASEFIEIVVSYLLRAAALQNP